MENGELKSTVMEEKNRLKQLAAESAVAFVRSGMVIGLGTGSTALFAVKKIAWHLNNNSLKNIVAVPSSLATEKEALLLGIPLVTLGEHPAIDLTIDGADEVDPWLNLIKGRGGALLREKILIQASGRTIIIVDESKLSTHLGATSPVPVEVLPFALKPIALYLTSLGGTLIHRLMPDGRPFLTDQGNYILDCNFGPIREPSYLALKMKERAGIVEHGLFLGLVSDVIVAGQNGIRHLRAK